MISDEDIRMNSVASNRHQSNINQHLLQTPNQWNDDKLKTRRSSNVLTIKSSRSHGYRYLFLFSQSTILKTIIIWLLSSNH